MAGRHYLDHASTTPLRPEARRAIEEWLADGTQADPGRVHSEGAASRAAIEQAREQVAAFLGARPREVVFTSGATEAIAAVGHGAAMARPGAAALLAGVEHSAVRESARRAGPVELIPVDEHGALDLEQLLALLDRLGRDTVSVVHCQWANHEVGTLQPVAEVVSACRERGVLVHVDAAAAAGHLAIDFQALGADLCSVGAHKFGGPTGAGALLVRRGLRLDPLLLGGQQERARRAGMENVIGIVGFGAVAEALSAPGRIDEEAASAAAQLATIGDAMTSVEGVRRLGHPTHRLPHLYCATVAGVEPEAVLLGLDQRGIAVHSGSACASEGLEPSPVLEAMGADADRSLRVSVGWSTTAADVAAYCDAFPEVISAFRSLAG